MSDIKLATATKGGKIHLANMNSNASFCMQYVGEVIEEDIQNESPTCKKCIKIQKEISIKENKNTCNDCLFFNKLVCNTLFIKVSSDELACKMFEDNHLNDGGKK